MANGSKRTAMRRSAKRASAARAQARPQAPATECSTATYAYPESDLALRPEIGTQPQFRKKKPPQRHRYDSSLSPSMEWDGQNPAREQGEWLIGMIEEAAALPAPHRFATSREFRSADGRVVASVHGLQDAVDQLKRLSQPFLNWAGKAERLSFDVPTLPLFVHERLSTTAIAETLKSHRRQERQAPMYELFADPRHPIADQVLKAYEHRDKWVNRMILGDNLAVMNSLLHYEGLGGQVQMIYIDPPYGVKFGSNFQPFVRKRDVTHNDDADITREPEMVKAYRDTWELGLHSYLTYLRDRLLLARELLHPSGSIFVQISDENVHSVRNLMDEVFGRTCFVSLINFQKTAGQTSKYLAGTPDYIVWYAKNIDTPKYRQLFFDKELGGAGSAMYQFVQLPDGTRRRLTAEELEDLTRLPDGARPYRLGDIISQRQGRASGPGSAMYFAVAVGGKEYFPPGSRGWTTKENGMRRLASLNRLVPQGDRLSYVRYLDDFCAFPIGNNWTDTAGASGRIYVVQTATPVIQRCLLMTTDPGDLVLDPTCGSGATAYVAEQWGRRWITIDISRVPLALARQRLLTATYPYYQLKDESRGPAGGFVYVRKQNRKGEEVGGIVPHVTLKSIANDEPPAEEVLVDRPEVENKITRVSGPFCVEGTIPTPVDWDGDGVEDSGADTEAHGSHLDRMLEVLRKSPVLQVGGGQTVTLKNIRLPAKSLSLSAEPVIVAVADTARANGAE